MTGTTHAAVGGLIAVSVSNPAMSLPLAFGSHFVLDALPHFGEYWKSRTWRSKAVWVVDIPVMMVFWVVLLINSQDIGISIFLGSFLAVSPDFVWAVRLLDETRNKSEPKPMGRLSQWHVNIQKYETTKGIPIDISVAFVALYLLVEST